MAGLFMTPEQVAALERQQRVGVGSSGPEALAGQLFNLGHSLSGAGMRAFGVDTRSPAQQRAAEMQELVKGTNLKDNTSIQDTAGKLFDAGFQNEAAQVLNLMGPAPPVTFGEMRSDTFEVTDPDTGNRTAMRVFGQNDSRGEFHKKFAITSSGQLTDPNSGKELNLRSDFLKNIGLEENVGSLIQNRFADALSKEQFADLEVDDVADKGMEGQVVIMANELRTQQINEFMEVINRLESGGVVLDQKNFDALARNYIDPDTVTVNKAFDTFLGSGDFRKMLQPGLLPLTEPGVGAQASESPSLAGSQAGLAKEQARQQALLKTADRTGGMVIKDVAGDPRKGQFSMFNLDSPKQAPQREAFLGALTGLAEQRVEPEQALEALQEQGFNFGPESLDVHIPMWQMIKENGPIANQMLSRVGDRRSLENDTMDDIQRLADEGRWPEWAESKAILRYLLNLGNPREGARSRRQSQRGQGARVTQ